MATNTIQNTQPKYAVGKNPNSLKNLKPFTLQDKKEARECGRKGGIKSGETRRGKRTQKEYLREILADPIKKLLISKEKQNEICQSVGVKNNTPTYITHVLGLVERAIIEGDKYASDKLWDADGSADKTPQENILVANFNITKGADDIIQRLAKKAKNHAESDHEDI